MNIKEIRLQRMIEEGKKYFNLCNSGLTLREIKEVIKSKYSHETIRKRINLWLKYRDKV